jgi:hypothetical protein
MGSGASSDRSCHPFELQDTTPLAGSAGGSKAPLRSERAVYLAGRVESQRLLGRWLTVNVLDVDGLSGSKTCTRGGKSPNYKKRALKGA